VPTPAPVPGDLVERTAAICLALPSFCLLVAIDGPDGAPRPLLVLRADPDEREVLLAIGHPYFSPPGTTGRLGVFLTGETGWDEIRELVTESYRTLAPRKLIARIEDP
jgi:hypothetical protein